MIPPLSNWTKGNDKLLYGVYFYTTFPGLFVADFALTGDAFTKLLVMAFFGGNFRAAIVMGGVFLANTGAVDGAVGMPGKRPPFLH